MNFGQNVRAIRQSKGIKAKFVAEKIGIAQPEYSNLERGLRKLTAEIIVNIADVLGVTTDDILRPSISGSLTSGRESNGGPAA